ncbi:ATP-dependent DNA helicase RecG [Kallotenue papyrolyticum]|uniref:ATP-dependent DNA helicase RecG n=1 Tax=Kallotenue papyrolyticum TaxID=1325125 RepID=UPI0004B109C0|nr:ATP-dependent DNA helicase RecG [Kallotenue papyrolyticum]
MASDSDMERREAIIELGRCLAAEAQAGYGDTAVPGGLEAFLRRWQQRANGVADDAVVRAALLRLEGYAACAPDERKARLDESLAQLRALFKSMGNANRARAGGKTARAPLTLASPLSQVPGIAPTLSKAFARLGVRTVEDLLYHFPHRYDDYSSRTTIAGLSVGAIETVVGRVAEVKTFTTRSNLSGVNLLLEDETGRLSVTFFGQRWLANQLKPGDRIVVSGKVTAFNGRLQMNGPSWEPYREDELIHAGRLVPVHPLTRGMHERGARTTIKRVIDLALPLVREHLPDEVRARARLMALPQALRQIHFPDDHQQLAMARYRLGFDEFLFIQIGVLRRKRLWQGVPGYALRIDAQVHAALQQHLPFQFTGAQQRAIDEIFADLQRPVPMARLLQGDVGSGKTVVAAAALLQAIANGFQGALMAPTEILAEQHYRGLKRVLSRVPVPRAAKQLAERSDDWKQRVAAQQLERMQELKRLLGMSDEEDMDGAGVRVALLTGSLTGKQRKRVLESIARGEVDLVIGTHALIQEGVVFNSLGLVVIDEQHRFGVEQRERLKSKGHHPHLLVMTATPIPRSLALAIYGDLDTSIIDERPPGRQPIKTRWITQAEIHKAYKHMRKEIAAGRQAFVICPLVDESEKLELASAVETQEHLQHEIFPDLRVGLVHGRMSQAEKDAVMQAFRDRRYDILVATAVVEVGIDIPNASTILILGAERFGLAQLHQFRGRVGRGEHQSYCIVVSDVDNEVTEQRLRALEESEDGFVLAEKDLEMRGPGEFFGRRQSGTPDLKMARLGDTRLLHAARLEAERILQADPDLTRPEHALLKQKVDAFWANAGATS